VISVFIEGYRKEKELMGWFGTIEYNGNKRDFRNAAELSLRMIEFYQKWYIDNFRRRPDEREIKNFFTYRNGIKSIGLVDTADYHRIFSGDRSNWYTDEFIRINGSAYYVQQWEVGDLAALEIKMRDNLGCTITRYCDISNRTNYAYQDTKYNDARRDVIRGNGYRLPAYPIQMPELIVFYKTTIRKEDRV